MYLSVSCSWIQRQDASKLTVAVVAFLALVAVAFFSVLGSAFSFFAAGLASFASFLASFMLPDFWPGKLVSKDDS